MDHKPPKRFISQYNFIYKILKVVRTDKCAFVLTSSENPDSDGDEYFPMFAFPMEEGIGGRMVPQWDRADFLGSRLSKKEAEYSLRIFISQYPASITPSVGQPVRPIWD